MFDGKYLEWNQKRIKGIIDYYGHPFMVHKKILDLGCGHADISGALHRLGADVTAVDARQEHLKVVGKKFPGVKTIRADLDRDWPFYGKQYDLILDLDLISHLNDYQAHLRAVCASTTHLILETAVCDSEDPLVCIRASENKNIYDLSVNGVAMYPSAAAIERVLKECGFSFRRLDTSKFNSGSYIYDWQPQNNNCFDLNKRRIWFAIKDSSQYVTTFIPRNIPSQAVISAPAPFKVVNVMAAQEARPQFSQPVYNQNMRFVDNVPTSFNKAVAGNTKVKIFIVTYRSDQLLNSNLESIISSDVMHHNPQIVVINNHSDFRMDHKFNSHVQVLHNAVRPDFSTGHLSRNWNQAIINGFVDLNNPNCDILVTCQVDTVFNHDWFRKLCDLHKTYSLIQYGAGDNFVSYLPEAVKKIGMWDERFCNIGYQEADYFLRALMYNKYKSCINDYAHGRLLNPTDASIINKPPVDRIHFDDHIKSTRFHKISAQVFRKKYGTIHPDGWTDGLRNNPPQSPLTDSYVYYPYFEKDVENLIGKGYIWANDHIY